VDKWATGKEKGVIKVFPGEKGSQGREKWGITWVLGTLLIKGGTAEGKKPTS